MQVVNGIPSVNTILDANGKMALLEYLMFKYTKSIQQTLDAPQGSNEEEVKNAQVQLENSGLKTQAKLAIVQQALTELQAANEALSQAVADLKAQEDAYNNKIKVFPHKLINH